MLGRSRTEWLIVAIAIGFLGAFGVFIIDVGTSSPDPVEYDETVAVGLSLEDQYALDENVTLPRSQVFYSQYSYVVGYQGVERFVDSYQQETHEERFGYPLAAYVSDYSAVETELTDEGYPIADRTPPWTDAESAWFVVGSDARSPTGETVVSFAERDDAAAFAASHGGAVRDWDALFESSFDIGDATAVRERLDDRLAAVDDTGDRADSLRDRPVSVVVGEDEATIQDAIDAAPANTTVVVPDGHYDEQVAIDRPITLAGDGTVTIEGPGRGSVVTATANRTAITGVEITGVGDRTSESDEIPDHAPDSQGEDWDDDLVDHYAGGDAGIVIDGGAGSLVADVSIETPSNGVLLHESSDTVVRNATVDGHESWRDGRAGVSAIHSAAVVEKSTIRDGRDGIYTHDSPGIVLRNNTIIENRIGVHLMHTSDALIVGNDVRDQDGTGIYVMTGPERIAIVENTVRNADTGIIPDSDDAYVASNVIEGNRVGIQFNTAASIFQGNVVAGNTLGVDVRSVLPTNRVVGNDFLSNYEHVRSSPGPLRIWSDDDDGNYWHGATMLSDTGDRPGPYSATDAVDSRLHATDGTATLARSPALEVLAGFEGMIPGLRGGAVTDSKPTCSPTNPDLVDRTEWAEYAWTCDDTTRDAHHGG